MQFTYETPELEQESAALSKPIAAKLQNALGTEGAHFQAFWGREGGPENPRYVLTIEELEAAPVQVKAYFTKDDASDPHGIDFRVYLSLASLYRQRAEQPRHDFVEESTTDDELPEDDSPPLYEDDSDPDIDRLEQSIRVLKKKIETQQQRITQLNQKLQEFIRHSNERIAELQQRMALLDELVVELERDRSKRNAKRMLLLTIAVNVVGILTNVALVIFSP